MLPPEAAACSACMQAACAERQAIAVQASDAHGGREAVLRMAGMLEGILRSCNNLAERVHHSRCLYLMAGISHLVPLAVYMVPLVALMLIPPLLVSWRTTCRAALQAHAEAQASDQVTDLR